MREINVGMLTELVTRHAQDEIRENKVSVKEIIVHQNGNRVYHGLFGATEAQARERIIFRAASMTKPITSAAVSILADRGLLDLDRPAYDYYPQMKHLHVAEIKDNKIISLRPVKNTIRVRDLLSHTSGIGCAPLFTTLEHSGLNLSLQQAVETILTHPLSFEPLTDQAYSATDAFDIAAGIAEIVSGVPFDEFLEENLFKPLGMTDTTFSPTPEQWKRFIPMHNRTKDGRSETVSMPEGDVFETASPKRCLAGGGLCVTAEDYIRFADMLCLGGITPVGVRILSPESILRMRTSNLPECVKMGSESWALGMRVITSSDYPHGLGVGCFGWSGAYGTHFWVDPENSLSVVMMKNSLYDGGAGNRSACELERDVTESLKCSSDL